MSVRERRENINKEVDVINKFVLLIFFGNPSDKQLTIVPDEGSDHRRALIIRGKLTSIRVKAIRSESLIDSSLSM
jgi:hypothetical protein